MKKSVKYIIVIITLFGLFYFKNDIINTFTAPAKRLSAKKVVIPKDNEYKIFDGQYSYIQSTNNFIPSDKQSIMNIIYTMLNSGWETFTFYCPKEYESCIDDVTSITNNNDILSNINNFVHPYNSFKTIETNYTTSGEVTLIVHKVYSDDMIDTLNENVNGIYDNIIYDSMNDKEKIKTIHDYIINNSKYDSEKISGVTKNNSNNAYGILIDGYGICSGYTDAMALFLNKMKIQNIKVSSDKHIWNLVYLDGTWLNLDLTFDDPVTDTGEDVLNEDYFLVDTNKMISQDKSNQHYFDDKVFVEAK